MKHELSDIPICPFCNEPQYNYSGSVNLMNAEYERDVLHICEHNDCEKYFFIQKIEREPVYVSYREPVYVNYTIRNKEDK